MYQIVTGPEIYNPHTSNRFGLFVYQIVTGPEITSHTSNRFGHSSNHNFVCMCGVYGGCSLM